MPASFVDCRGYSADTRHPSFDAVLQTEDPKESMGPCNGR
jgi:hypothetical protein